MWGAASRALDADAPSGDDFFVRALPHGFVVAVADGLGHGEEAAVAARLSIQSLDGIRLKSLVSALARCHERLRGTRGAALTLAGFDARNGSMTWLGVGSVEAALWRAEPGNGPRTNLLVLRNGVVGLHYAPLQAETIHVRRGDTLVLTTDGIRGGFAVDVGRAPQRIADGILAQYSKATDDALVLVARYVGNGA